MAFKLTKPVIESITAQAAVENHNSNVYLAAALWADDKGLFGTKKWCLKNSGEEREHQIKFLDYLLDLHCAVELGAVAATGPINPTATTMRLFELILETEEKTTANIESMRQLAKAEKDELTYSFLSWYCDEQAQSIGVCRDILAKLALGGDIYEFDSWVEEL